MMNCTGTDFLTVGKVRCPHGVKGEIRVEMYSGGVRQLLEAGRIYLDDGVEFRKIFEIVSARATPRDVLLKLAGIEDRNSAELLRGFELVIDRTWGWKLDEGTYIIGDLIGFELCSPEGRKLGTVVGGTGGESHDYLIVDTPFEKEALVPFVRQFIQKLDEKTGRIIAVLPEGLL